MDAGGTNLIDITVDGKAFPSLARDVQRHVIKKNILHVDFLAVDMSETIQADIPIVFLNESPVVSSRQGIMITGTNTVTIEVLPADLINEIEVDLSTLEEIGDGITVGDLSFAEGTTVINDPEDMIVKILQPSAARSEELEDQFGEGEEGEEGEATEGTEEAEEE